MSNMQKVISNKQLKSFLHFSFYICLQPEVA
jgi:hypothetical protein